MHGFFTIMGGFMEYHDNGPPTVLEANDVPAVTKRQILEVEIRDKSKGDTIKNFCPSPNYVVHSPVHLMGSSEASPDEAGGGYVCICLLKLCNVYSLVE